MAEIFLSYSRADAERAAAVVNRLEALGHSVWWDRELAPGGNWSHELEAVLDRASHVIVLWTPKSVESDWVQKEAALALERRKLIPVFLEPCSIPKAFAHIQTADLRQGSDEQYRNLSRALLGSAGVRRKWIAAGIAAVLCLASAGGYLYETKRRGGRQDAQPPSSSGSARPLAAGTSPQLSPGLEPAGRNGPYAAEERTFDGITYVWVPPGSFMMGCSPEDRECHQDELPAHRVTISNGFWLGKSEVTQASYQALMGSNPSTFQGPNRPVQNVTGRQALTFCEKVGGRLPTEAEWEYAARGGATGARYGLVDAIAWHTGNANAETHDVMTRAKNNFGLYDMLGNVWEYVSDHHRPYSPGAAIDPKVADAGDPGILRGGSFNNDPSGIRVSMRFGTGSGYASEITGIRCAKDLR